MTQTTTLPARKGGNTIKDLLSRPDVRQSIADVLPKHLTPDKLTKIVLVACSRQPKLMQCDTASLLKAVMTAAELGLNPGGSLGEGYLVPFENRKANRVEVTFIPGYRGLIQLARRSGQISMIYAEVVREGDIFERAMGLEPKLIHVPSDEADRESKPIKGSYAVAVFKEPGVKQWVYMAHSEIEEIRKRSRAGASGPWITDYAEMCKKTVIRRLCKQLPLAVDEPLGKAVEIEDRFESGDNTVADIVSNVPDEPTEPKAAGLARRLTAPPVSDGVPTAQELDQGAEEAFSGGDGAATEQELPEPGSMEPDEQPPAPAPAPEPAKPKAAGKAENWWTVPVRSLMETAHVEYAEAEVAVAQFARKILGKPLKDLTLNQQQAIIKHIADGDIKV